MSVTSGLTNGQKVGRYFVLNIVIIMDESAKTATLSQNHLCQMQFPQRIPIPVGHLLLIGAAHFIGIVKPLEYERIVTKERIKICVIICWLFPMAFVFIWFSALPGRGFQSNGCEEVNFMEELQWRLVYSSFFFFSFLAIVCIYTRIYWIARQPNREDPNSAILENELNFKALKTTGIIVGSYLFGVLPATFLYALSYDDGPLNFRQIGKITGGAIGISGDCLLILKSLLNPFIYAVFQPDVKIAQKRLKYAIKEKISGPIPLDEFEKTSLYALEHDIVTNTQNQVSTVRTKVKSTAV
ncbi:unnamed protein product [Allacma fusca]|uniref:G-protein coupled receptors family 1 profile domain-containing protein n=1 Tax=Allacma fusca TaxID=39272 RepID=A0A8J2JRY5_9HEXA|nr:unnamed protein product [Allacma fusca]